MGWSELTKKWTMMDNLSCLFCVCVFSSPLPLSSAFPLFRVLTPQLLWPVAHLLHRRHHHFASLHWWFRDLKASTSAYYRQCDGDSSWPPSPCAWWSSPRGEQFWNGLILKIRIRQINMVMNMPVSWSRSIIFKRWNVALISCGDMPVLSAMSLIEIVANVSLSARNWRITDRQYAWYETSPSGDKGFSGVPCWPT